MEAPIPPSFIDISKIPLSTPIYAHFSQIDSSCIPAKELTKIWDTAIKKGGGIHSHGFHTLEAQVVVHEGFEDDSFLKIWDEEIDLKLGYDEKWKEKMLKMNDVWDHISKFYHHHLKCV